MNKTELKVRAASLAAFMASLVGITVLQASGAEWIRDLPLWLQAPAGALLLAGITWLSGRQTKSKPDYLSPSTIAAAEQWLKNRLPKQTLR
jgi:hypothetical protein